MKSVSFPTHRTLLALIILVMGLPGSLLNAQILIEVPNGSFDTPATPVTSSSNSKVVFGWVFGRNGETFGTSSISSDFTKAGTSSGRNYAFIDGTNTITSAASLATIAPDADYILTVALGKPTDITGGGSGHETPDVTFSLLANGKVVATDTLNQRLLPTGSFDDYSLTYTAPTTGPLIGENLTIRLEATNDTVAAFDNVRLESIPSSLPDDVPEPPTWILIAPAITIFGCLRFRVRSNPGSLSPIDRPGPEPFSGCEASHY